MAGKMDVRSEQVELYFLPVQMRVPLKFGLETLTHLTCARVKMTVADGAGNRAEGWGETPLSVQWAWPSDLLYEDRHEVMKSFCLLLSSAWADLAERGHAMELGAAFLDEHLGVLLEKLNARRAGKPPMPWLAALICCSAFDQALHDAYGNLHGAPVYELYGGSHMNRDLATYLDAADGTAVSFAGKYPADYFVERVPVRIPAWHLVGGKDLIDESERTGVEPDDGFPVLLRDWIRRDGLQCLKIKLRGNDVDRDYDRLVKIGTIAMEENVLWLSSDFNCTVADPAYVTGILDRLMVEHPPVFQRLLYVEQPFPYDLERNRIDVHSVSARKPLFMDESAHDWRLIKLGRTLGWTGVALKTCKTQTGALLSMCWAKAHGMTLMVQDLTNSMLAQIPHVLLAAHAGTIMGVETNAPQFCPEASLAEAKVHPGLYQRRTGCVDLGSLRGPGFGYRVAEIGRGLPLPSCAFGKG